MKATQNTRKAANHVDVRRDGEGGFIYKCLLCDYIMNSNAPNETTYKAMVAHAAKCDGTNPRPLGHFTARNGDPGQTQIVPFPTPPIGDIEAFNKYVHDYAAHIKYCVPNGHKLNDKEAIALARIAMDTGLSPFTGEVSYLPGKGPHIGIEGLRRKAKEQALYSKSHRAMTPDEIKEHGVRVDVGDIGYVCQLWRHDLTQDAARINALAGEVVIQIEPILGFGIFHTAGWQTTKRGEPYPADTIPNGRSAAWVARKRSEADALRQAYDIGISLPYHDEPEYLPVADNDEEWSVVSQRQAVDNAERRPAVKDNSTQAVVTKYTEAAQSYDDVVDQYVSGAVALPEWLLDLRKDIEADPKATEPMSPHWVHHFVGIANDRITTEQLQAFLRILFQNPTHEVEELTFGAVRVLKPFVTDNSGFEAQVIGLLS